MPQHTKLKRSNTNSLQPDPKKKKKKLIISQYEIHVIEFTEESDYIF